MMVLVLVLALGEPRFFGSTTMSPYRHEEGGGLDDILYLHILLIVIGGETTLAN